LESGWTLGLINTIFTVTPLKYFYMERLFLDAAAPKISLFIVQKATNDILEAKPSMYSWDICGKDKAQEQYMSIRDAGVSNKDIFNFTLKPNCEFIIQKSAKKRIVHATK